jgi:hypothetical protein
VERGAPRRPAWRGRLDLWDDDGGWRPLPDPRRNSLLDRAVRTLPGLQGVEARLLRLIDRKLERREPIEPVQRKPRARAQLPLMPPKWQPRFVSSISMSCAISWRAAPLANGARVVLAASGAVCSARLLSAAAILVPSSGLTVFAGGEDPDAAVFAGAGVLLCVGSTAITRLVAPEFGAFSCRPDCSADLVLSASFFWRSANCSCWDYAARRSRYPSWRTSRQFWQART